MSSTVKQHLWFAKDMEKALRFYTSLIPVRPVVKQVSPLCGEGGRGGGDPMVAR